MAVRKTVWIGRRKQQAALLACLAGVLAAPMTAAAKKPPSAVDAYRESVPTSGGSRAVGSGGGSGLPLSPGARSALHRAGAEGRTLKRIATSPKLGAPSKRLGGVGHRNAHASIGRGLAAATGAIGSGNAHVLALLAALGATTLGCALAASSRKRRKNASRPPV